MSAQTFKTHLALFCLLFAFGVVVHLNSISRADTNSLRPLPQASQLKFLGPDDAFIVYYGDWPVEDTFFKTMRSRFKLIILNTEDIKLPANVHEGSSQAADYKKSRIKMLQAQGAMVFAYLSVGEENTEGNNNKPYTGDKLGPCSATDPKSCKKGYASYYIDDGSGYPAIHGTENFVSAYVNAGKPSWRAKMKREASALMALGATGLFLDTIDTATTKNYEWTQPGMIQLLEDLNIVTPNIIVNRGIALLETNYADAYKKLSWAIMFENFYTDWVNGMGVKSEYYDGNINYWTPMLKGKNVLVVDFANYEQWKATDGVVKEQKIAVAKAMAIVNSYWPNYIAGYSFKEIRYESGVRKTITVIVPVK
jgi:endo-alpha-1,4-polygalactosaminidase (GH114 family)